MDTNDVFESISDIDAMLDKEFGEVANEPTEEDSTITDNEEVTSLEEDTEETPVVEEQVEQPEQIEDTGKNDKKDYAFAELRAENGNLKKERDSYKSDSDFLKSLAMDYGYDDISKFQEALKLSRYQREAQEKGYNYDLYRRTMEQEERIAQLEKERASQENERKLERFKTALDSAAVKYEVEESEIFSRLEDAGLTVEELLSISNPKLLLDGVLSDKIQEKAKQSQINQIQNMNGLVEDKNEQNAQGSKVTIDSLLKSDLAKYKADNFL